MKNKNGITLIVLVITIIVLLILAGVNIAMLTGQNGILTQAQNAKITTENKNAEEKVKLAVIAIRSQSDIKNLDAERLKEEIEKSYGGSAELTNGDFPVNITIDGKSFRVDASGDITNLGNTNSIPTGLKIGSTVTYISNGTYRWEAEYCSSIKTEDVILDSNNENYKIQKWKVLNIENEKVTLVPEAQTMGTVYLGEAQGYNNGVKLLNDACNNLYGNSNKGITARSINIEDIKKYMTKSAVNSIYEYNNGTTSYNTQVTNTYITNKSYPAIYVNENLSVIDGEENKEGLKINEQATLLKRNTENIKDGYLIANKNIQPYQTCWYKENSFMQTAFKNINNEESYYNLILPKGENTAYWIASRCIDSYSDTCNFDINYVNKGRMNAYGMCNSNKDTSGYEFCLFPIIATNTENIMKNLENEFYIDI